MIQRLLLFLSILMALCISTIAFSSTPPADAANALRPSLRFEFENCVAFAGGSSADYSEFVAETAANSGCTQLSVLGDNLYRINPNRNSHSCAPGRNGTSAMCISGDERCTYFPGDEKSLRINVMVEPGPDGIGSLDNIAFFSMAPDRFMFIEGMTGTNNYPTKFGIRVLTDNGEIYRSDNIETAREWAFRSFDLSSIGAATVTTPTLFRIEILPYCLVGNDSDIQAWDIEDLVITGGCNSVNGGVISTTSSTALCSANGQNAEVSSTVTQTKGQTFSWLAVDANQEILRVQNSGDFNFSNLPSGQLRIFHLSVEGPISGLTEGGFIYDLGGCYDLSNSITVTNSVVRGGNLSGPGQTSTFTICPISSNVLNTSLSGNSGDGLTYLLTDTDGVIIAQYNQSSIDFSTLGVGNYNLTALSYNDISGLVNGANISTLTGCFAQSSSVSISRSNASISGGSLSSAGQAAFSFCNNMDSVIVDLAGNAGTNSNFIITNPSGRILSIQSDNEVRIGGISEDEFSVWNISFENGIAGLEIDAYAADLAGCFDLSNPIVISRDQVSAGVINVTGGEETTTLCLRNNENQAVEVQADSQFGDNLTYIVADEGNNIVNITQLDNQNAISFDGAVPGVCYIYALAYNGSISGLSMGNNIAALDGSCFDLSLPITVERNEVESGSIDGPVSYEVCLNDGMDSELQLMTTGAAANFATWVVTDADGNILETTGSGLIDFGTASAGVCLVYSVAHSDSPLLLGPSGNIADLVSGCFDISEPVTINRTRTEGGSFSLANGATSTMVLVGQGATANFSTTLTDNIGDTTLYLIYDTEGMILSTQTENTFDFNNAALGVCSIVAVSYVGDLGGATVGNRIDMLTGCFSQSNAIVVTKQASMNGDTLNPGIILTSAGALAADICIGNSISDSLTIVYDQLPLGANAELVITDETGQILAVGDNTTIFFGSAGAGICSVYSIVYQTAPLANLEAGNNLMDLDTADYLISTPIVVTRNIVSGGTLTSSDTLTRVSVIVGDGLIDTIDLVSTGAVGDNSTIILTDTLGVITSIPTLPLTFDTEPAGVCLAWNLTYADGLEGLMAQNSVTQLDGCFVLSNAVRITKTAFATTDTLSGGRLLTIDTLETLTLCDNDPSGTLPIDLVLSGAAGDSMALVLTDAVGEIFDLRFALPYDYNQWSDLDLQLSNISWTDTLQNFTVGSNINNITGDFDLSNFVTISANTVVGGSIATTEDSTNVSIVVGDGIVDTIAVLLTGAVGDTANWVITDIDGNILELPTSSPFIFEDAGAGVCLIWNLSSVIGLDSLAVGNNVSQVDGCFSLSNPITVTRTAPQQVIDGGQITTTDTLTTVDLCLSSIDTEVNLLLDGAIGDTMRYFTVSASGVIIAVSEAATFDFSGVAAGTCDIYHISYSGPIEGLVASAMLDSLAGNFDLSNKITVNRSEVDGGVLALANGMTEVSIIVGDGIIDSIDVVLTGIVGDTTQWVVTDTLGNILELPLAPPFTFEGAEPGVCLLWNLSYATGLDSLAVGNNASQLTGCFDLSNAVRVVRTEAQSLVEGGMIITSDSLMTAEICQGTASTSVDILLSGAIGDSSRYLLVNDSGAMIGISELPTFSLGTVPIGVCNIYHLSYNDTISGLIVGEMLNSLAGDFDLSNTIVVTKDEVDGGALALSNGMTEVSIVIGDGSIDSIDVVLTGMVGDTMQWVVTDTLGNILELPVEPPFIFEGAGAGVCRIWNLSYAVGLDSLEVGNNVSQLDGCFDLSNPVTVTRTVMMSNLTAGTIMTTDTMVVANVCLNSLNLAVEIVSAGVVADSTTYVLTDTSGIIIDTFLNSPVTFGSNPNVDICEIWNVGYNGTLTGLAAGMSIDSLMGEYALSNQITVTKQDNEGGIAQFDNSTFLQTITVGDGIPDTLNVMLSSIAVGDSMIWVVTDADGVIDQLSNGTQFIFNDTLTAGTCNIAHLSFSYGLTGLEVGNNAFTDLGGCFDFSPLLSVVKEAAVNNTLIPGNLVFASNGTNEIDLCVGDNGAEIDLMLSGANGPQMSFITTDTAGVILQLPATEPIQFPADTTTTCELYHIVYDTTITGLMVGDTLDSLGGNFILSNLVTVSKMQLEANSIALANTMTSASVTTADGMTDTLIVVSSAIAADTSVYVTTDANGFITAIQDTTTFLFENQPSGICFIQELSYNFGFTGLVGGTNLSDLEGCFALSNAIQVTKTSVAGINGGVITTPNGNNITACLSNALSDSIMVTANSAAGDTSVWVVTDTFGVVLALPEMPPFVLDTLGAGACQIWNLSYNFPLTGLAIDSSVMNLSGVFDFSNPVAVDKNFSSAGTLETALGMSFDTIMLGSTPVDTLFVSTGGMIVGENTAWLVTDTLGNIIELPTGPTFTFEGGTAGQCNLWNLAYADGISGLGIGSNINTDLGGCYDLSDSIRVVKVNTGSTVVNAGTIAFLDGSTSIDVCFGNAVIDSSQVVIDGQFGTYSSFLITTTNGIVLADFDTLSTAIDTVLVELESSPAPELYLYHIAYEDGVENLGLFENINQLVGMFDLSNFLTLNNVQVNAGDLVNTDTLNVVVGEGIIDTITVSQFGGFTGDDSYWVVYDDQGVITSVDTIFSTIQMFTFEDNGNGILNVVRMAASSGLMGLEVDANMADLDGCFDITTPKVIITTQSTLAGGLLLASDNTSIVDYCFNGTYTMDSVFVILADTLGDNFSYVHTDTSGMILELTTSDTILFDSMDPATSFIWNIAFDTILPGLVVGQDIDTLMGDFSLSNPVTVNVNNVNGGLLSTPSGETLFEYCVGDGELDVLNFMLADTVGGNYQYVITDVMNNILLVPTSGNNFIDFEGFGDGDCRIFNLSSTQEIVGLTVNMNVDSLVGCYDLSNFLTVVKNGVDGNSVTAPEALDNFTMLCVSDTTANNGLTLSTGSTMGSYQYVITDENNEIDSVLVGNFIDFDGADFGTCKIFGVSYTGTFTGMPGDTVGVQMLSSECMDVTDIPITIVKQDCSVPIITEIGGDGLVEIQNIGTAPVDVASYFLCASDGAANDYEEISNLVVNCGMTLLQPGDYVVVELSSAFNINPDDGEFALYSSPNFGSSSDILHYVEWGSTPHLRTSTAVIASIWTTGQFATTFSATTALKYDGSGFIDTDWSEGSPTPCLMNFGSGSTAKRLTYETYPNPTNGNFKLYIPELSSGAATLVIYDSFGKTIETRIVQAGIRYDIDLSDYGSGLYYTKVIAGYEGVVKKMMIVK